MGPIKPTLLLVLLLHVSSLGVHVKGDPIIGRFVQKYYASSVVKGGPQGLQGPEEVLTKPEQATPGQAVKLIEPEISQPQPQTPQEPAAVQEPQRDLPNVGTQDPQGNIVGDATLANPVSRQQQDSRTEGDVSGENLEVPKAQTPSPTGLSPQSGNTQLLPQPVVLNAETGEKPSVAPPKQPNSAEHGKLQTPEQTDTTDRSSGEGPKAPKPEVAPPAGEGQPQIQPPQVRTQLETPSGPSDQQGAGMVPPKGVAIAQDVNINPPKSPIDQEVQRQTQGQKIEAPLKKSTSAEDGKVKTPKQTAAPPVAKPPTAAPNVVSPSGTAGNTKTPIKEEPKTVSVTNPKEVKGKGTDKNTVAPKVSVTVPPVPDVNKTTTVSATAISSTIPAVLITSVVFLYLSNW